MSTATSATVTPEQFLALPDRDRYEFVDGRLLESNASLHSIRIAGTIYWKLEEYAKATGLGWAWPPETFVRCFPDRAKFRKPDACFLRLERVPADWIDEADP